VDKVKPNRACMQTQGVAAGEALAGLDAGVCCIHAPMSS
jgi:hypothetical protein